MLYVYAMFYAVIPPLSFSMLILNPMPLYGYEFVDFYVALGNVFTLIDHISTFNNISTIQYSTYRGL